MSRFDRLLKSLDKAVETPVINPGEEAIFPENEPRNMLTKVVNPYLEKLGMEIPSVSVADRKRFVQDAMNPETMALNFGIGGIAKSNRFQELAKKFGGSKLEVPALNENLSKRISDAFSEMKHDPNNPQVKEAYDALIKEVTAQYDDLAKSGVKAKKIKGENPYKNSKELSSKVKESGEISYFPTDEGFGSAAAIADNPMLQKTGRFNADGEEMLANDIFRAVHDVYGHVKPESSFGKVGEEIAYQNHKQMFSPLAQKALATETRGQNSYVNFGPNAAHNKTNPANTIFADQKVGLLPDWAINENAAKPISEPIPAGALTGIGNSLSDEEMKKQALQQLINK